MHDDLLMQPREHDPECDRERLLIADDYVTPQLCHYIGEQRLAVDGAGPRYVAADFAFALPGELFELGAQDFDVLTDAFRQRFELAFVLPTRNLENRLECLLLVTLLALGLLLRLALFLLLLTLGLFLSRALLLF